MEKAKVLALSVSPTHSFSKTNQYSIRLVENLGMEGDAHAGVTVKHRSRVAQDPTQPNLRQVHLIHSELHEELSAKGYEVAFGQMGENITTVGIDLLNLPKNTILTIGKTAKVQITGLRNPCHQLNGIKEGLMNELVFKNADGEIVRKAGIMGIVLASGTVYLEDEIVIELPPPPFEKLERV